MSRRQAWTWRNAGLWMAFIVSIMIGAAARADLTLTQAGGYSMTWDGNDGNYYTPAGPADAPANLSTGTGASAFASGVIGVAPHAIDNVRNGTYGNYSSWIGNSSSPLNFVGINLGGTYDVNAIAWGRDNGTSTANGDSVGGISGQFTDRSLGTYTVQITNDLNPSASTTNWTTVGAVTYNSSDDTIVGGAFTSYYRHEYGLAKTSGPLLATGVRLIAASSGNDIAVDELELYGSSPVPQTGLKAWLRGDGDVQTSGTDVTQWSDHSGNNNHATAITQYPSLVPNDINGLSGVRFSDPVDHLDLPATGTNLNIANSDYEIFIVARSSSSAVQFLSSGEGVGGSSDYGVHLNGAAGARFIPSTAATTDGSHPDVYGDIGVAGEFSDGRAHLFDARVQNDVGILRVSGMENGDTVLNAQTAFANRLTLGVRGDATYSFVGDMGEVLVYNHALTAGERRTVERYLARKWNAPLNVASQTQGGVAFANQLYAGGTNPNHQISHLNDALYGNANSWLGTAAGGAGGFAGVKFDGAFDISSLAFGRDATGALLDRAIGTYTFQYTLDNFDAGDLASINAATWVDFMTVVYDGSTPTPWLRHQYDFATIMGVRGVRVQVSSDQLAIDELEVYGLQTIPEPTSAAMFAFGAASTMRRRRRSSRG